MSDPAAEPIDGEAEGDESAGRMDDASVWRALRLGAVGLLALLAIVATIRLYTNTSAAIAQWISPDYASAFQAAFNLVVLLLALAGLALLHRSRQ